MAAPWLHRGWDVAAAAQRRQPFPALLPLLSSVITGRGKSRGGGCALIAFHGREEKATARPEGRRRCRALCCLLQRETMQEGTHLLSNAADTHANIPPPPPPRALC
ncbi:unnamed protein product [Tetraodon nigroviridis]|uniref:(spotted green pufferfish) hypothetical protein n=1 Tax=Tetraodon nigroviridis TaxID=99883 RepID=Q4SJU6_TETNG|nr:unnamed protein product [Tetraodon nigroviridis]